MVTDKAFCMSSYLMFRNVIDDQYVFTKKYPNKLADIHFQRTPVCSARDLIEALQLHVADATRDGKAALALSGGIDSAILAKMMPAGSTAYTFKCVVPGVQVTDETFKAARFAEENKLRHQIVEVHWEDMERFSTPLMQHKGAPIHSIECQIYKAALQAKADGFDRIIFGENADIIYGGMDGLLAKDWTFGEFVDRYTYVKPYFVLKNPQMILAPFRKYCKDGHVDGHDFINEFFRQEALGTYTNACQTAGISFVGPYSKTVLSQPIDYRRIRSGETKYIVREAFAQLYPGHVSEPKTPMPRPMNEWLKDWSGPLREDMLAHCIDGMNGDQKWMIWALERFLNTLDEEGNNDE